MSHSRNKLIIKNAIKGTSIGKNARDILQKRGFTKTNAQKAYDRACMENKKLLEYNKSEIIKDMLVEARKYSFGFDEYFMYHFYELPFEERRMYVSDRERITYCERMNNIKNMIIFDDKSKTYEVYGKYYKRDLIEIFENTNTEKEIFADFIQKHSRFIVKPFDGACGVGIKIIDTNKEDLESLLEDLLRDYKRGFVAEELIVQTGILHDIHPQSVNTLRVPTIKYKNRTEIIHPILRVGRGNAIVDNGGAGGICCAINVATGG